MNKVIAKVENSLNPQEYLNFLKDIQNHIHQSQIEAFTAINIALNTRNWMIGKIITEKQENQAWGSNFLDSLAKDLQKMFPGNQEFSAPNIYRMIAFYQRYRNIITDVINLENLPFFTLLWGHNVVILTKIKNQEEAL